jgi:nucleoside-diphosphate-sugar epimerase
LNYLITGATGFIGSFLVKRLISEGHACRCLVRSKTAAKDISGLQNVELIEGDITDKNSLKNIAANMDYLFHLATLGHVHNFKVPKSMFEDVNVTGTRNIIDEAMSAGVKRIVHCSSVAAMGICDDIPANEESECRPHNPYGSSKLHAEEMVKNFFYETGLPAVIIRFSMVYGPGDWRDILRITRFVKRRIIPKIGDRPKLTPLIHVNDAVDGLILTMEKGKQGETYLITNKNSEPFDKILAIIANTLEIKCLTVPVPEWVALSAASAIEKLCNLVGKSPFVARKNIESTLADRVFSIEKAQKELGFNPSVDLERGLRDTVLWYREKGWI